MPLPAATVSHRMAHLEVHPVKYGLSPRVYVYFWKGGILKLEKVQRMSGIILTWDYCLIRSRDSGVEHLVSSFVYL